MKERIYTIPLTEVVAPGGGCGGTGRGYPGRRAIVKKPPETALLPGERLDALGHDGLWIIQNPRMLRFTTDSYLLAAFARPTPGQTVLELGSGSGVVLFLLAKHTHAARLVGLEIQPALVEMARRNIELNGLAGRLTVHHQDLREPAALDPAVFDLVVANPPYITAGAGCQSPHNPLALAKHELACTLREVVQAAARWLKPRGRFVLVHRPARLPEILAEMGAVRLVSKTLALVHPRPGEAAGILLIEARLGARQGLTVCPPLAVRDAQGSFTREMEEVFAGRWPWKQ